MTIWVMPTTTVKQIKVFIGSPGGLEDERKAALRIVDEINQSNSERWGCQLKLVGWEFTLPGNGRAQSRINRDLDTCSYFIGVVWDRWGSKPNDGDNKYTSGFEEEFERSREHVRTGAFKEIYLFFKKISNEKLDDPGDQLKQVLKFRKKCIDERDPLFKEFDSLSDFEPKVRGVLTEIGWRETEIGKSPEPIVATPNEIPDMSTNHDNVAEQVRLFEPPAIAFLQGLINRVAEPNSTNSSEVARLRLLGSTLDRSGNDQFSLGAHDANLLFAQRSEFEFSRREVLGLARAGVIAFQYQNAPLWHWLAKLKTERSYLAEIYWFAFSGESAQRIGAIRVLQRLGRARPEPTEFEYWDYLLLSWLQDEDRAVFDAAIKLLQENAQESLVAEIESLIGRVAPERANDVISLLISTVAKSNVNKAIEILIGRDPQQVSTYVVDAIFGNPTNVATEILQRCANLKSDSVRTAALLVLFSRREINVEQAKELTSSSDFGIRLAAIESLEGAGEKLAESDIKGLLVQRRPRGSLFPSLSNDDTTNYTTYQLRALKKLSFEELKKKVAEADAHSDIELSALCERYTKKAISFMLPHIRDGFKDFFQAKKLAQREKYGVLASFLKTDEVEPYYRKKFLTIALNALAKSNSRSLLGDLRGALDSHEVYYSREILKYLSVVGDWSDKDRIIKFNDIFHMDFGLLHSTSQSRQKLVGQALYRVAKSRLADLLELDIPPSVLAETIAAMSPADVNSLDDSMLLKLFFDKSDALRKVLALKCCLRMPRMRMRRLLKRYMEGDQARYYNVIHWLDLATSMPREIVKQVATAELADM